MPEAICNISPFQYLRQIDLLGILLVLTDKVIVPMD